MIQIGEYFIGEESATFHINKYPEGPPDMTVFAPNITIQLNQWQTEVVMDYLKDKAVDVARRSTEKNSLTARVAQRMADAEAQGIPF